LGYSVAILNYPSSQLWEGHSAIGLSVPMNFSYNNSSYAFIETTNPTIPTDVGIYSDKKYDIVYTANGSSFDSIAEEFYDVKDFENAKNIVSNFLQNGENFSQIQSNQTLQKNNLLIRTLNKKYGITEYLHPQDLFAKPI